MPRRLAALLPAVVALLVAAPAASAADCAGADLTPTAANVVDVRAAVVCLTNAERAQAGLAPVVAEGRLESAAQAFSGRMVTERFFDHVAPDGQTLVQRLAAYLGWRRIGENIAWGEGSLATPRSIVQSWMDSPGHRENILTADFSEIGIGVETGTPSTPRPGATYTQDFGVRRDGTAAQPVQAAPAPAPVAAVPTAAPAAVVKAPAAAKKTVKKKVVSRCRRGTVRRVSKARGKRVVRCVAVKKKQR